MACMPHTWMAVVDGRVASSTFCELIEALQWQVLSVVLCQESTGCACHIWVPCFMGHAYSTRCCDVILEAMCKRLRAAAQLVRASL
jgi:hypothetical protein